MDDIRAYLDLAQMTYGAPAEIAFTADESGLVTVLRVGGAEVLRGSSFHDLGDKLLFAHDAAEAPRKALRERVAARGAVG